MSRLFWTRRAFNVNKPLLPLSVLYYIMSNYNILNSNHWQVRRLTNDTWISSAKKISKSQSGASILSWRSLTWWSCGCLCFIYIIQNKNSALLQSINYRRQWKSFCCCRDRLNFYRQMIAAVHVLCVVGDLISAGTCWHRCVLSLIVQVSLK